MLLAATKATFKNEFGASFIRYDIQASNPSDLEFEKFKRQIEGNHYSNAYLAMFTGAQISSVAPLAASNIGNAFTFILN